MSMLHCIIQQDHRHEVKNIVNPEQLQGKVLMSHEKANSRNTAINAKHWSLWDQNITCDQQLISVTPIISRLAEKLVVQYWLRPALPNSLLQDQYVCYMLLINSLTLTLNYSWASSSIIANCTESVGTDYVLSKKQTVKHLTLSPPLCLYTLPYWSNPAFLIFDIRALWRSGAQDWAPERPNVKN